MPLDNPSGKDRFHMSWNARLDMSLESEGERTVIYHRHEGPLRLLQTLYPEGGRICHNVIVHPPGGIVGGDTLDIAVRVGTAAHGLVSTPGATRFYRSTGAPASQQVTIDIAEGGRLEWLPLETLAYDGCIAGSSLHVRAAPGAQMMGWDCLALGLPTAGQPFLRGQFTQRIEIDGLWLEHGCIDALDARLLDSPLGLNGHRCLSTAYLLSGSPLAAAPREQLLDQTRQLIASDPLAAQAGATCPNPQLLVVRMLSDLVEPAMRLLRRLWQLWRREAWQLGDVMPRIWSV